LPFKESFMISIPLLRVSLIVPPRSVHSLSQTDQWLFVMSTELIGFSLAGICMRFLVTPASMIWPYNLLIAAIINTLHSSETTGSRGYDGISRQRFFTYIFIGSIFYSQLLLCKLALYSDFPSSQRSFRLISSLLSQASHGSAGLRPRMSRLITSLASPMAWEWVSSPLTGVKSPTMAPLFPAHGGLQPTRVFPLCFFIGFFFRFSM
jgi:hypothetical protein